MASVDLHLHTTCSDGRLSPSQLIELAVQRGLQIVSITDHDSTEGLAEAFATAQKFPQLSIIPGIELSTDIPGNEVHILGYFIDYRDPKFQNTLVDFRDGRRRRAQGMVDKLAAMGVNIEWDRVQTLAGDGAIGRPHIAQAMVENGYIKYHHEAFENYIGRNGPAYVERDKLTPEDAVHFIQQQGGVAVLAHPAYIDNTEESVKKLKGTGIVGMEAYYAKYSPETIKQLVDMATRYNLLPCGGSDYHAIGTPGEPLPGDMGPPIVIAEQLKELSLAKKRSQ